MIFLRSTLYHVLFILWTVLLGLAYLPLLLGSRKFMQRAGHFWTEGGLWLQKHLLGLTFEVRGAENLPKAGAILAVKHQSAWETLVFHRLVGDPAFILKRELLFLPIVGWYLWKTGQIAIDRASGTQALKLMMRQGEKAVAEGRVLVIFPEGHRQPPGKAGRYRSGVAKLYENLQVPIVPVALNSGLFWRRNAYLRYPGHITLEVLPPIAPGLDRDAVLPLLHDQIEGTTRRLEKEAGQRHTAP